MSVVTTGDDLRMQLSDSGGTGFGSFPGAAVNGRNSPLVGLGDKEDPYDFLGGASVPRAMDPNLDGITLATGLIAAGGDIITFSIDPKSTVIVDDLPNLGVVVSPEVAGATAQYYGVSRGFDLVIE